MVVLETSRLVLRPFRPDDLDDLARLYADAEVRRHFPDGPLDRARTREELDWFLSGGDPARPGLVLHALVERATGRLIGRAGFLPWTLDGSDEVEIAYLLDRAHWRSGLGGEIAGALVRHGFEVLGLDRLVAIIHPDNLASVRTAERAGLRFERSIDVDGQPCLLHAIARRAQAGASGILGA